MQNFNKIISFVLGLVVVVVFLAIITGRLNLKSKLLSQNSITPTPTNKLMSPTPSIKTNFYQEQQGQVNQYQTNGKNTVNKPTTIPSTGAPTLLLPIAISALFGGSFLKKTGKKS